MSDGFIYQMAPSRVVFGTGSMRQAGAEIKRLGATRAMVITTPGRGEDVARNLAAALGPLCAGICAEAVMHSPVAVTERVLPAIHAAGADSLIAIGGGSAIGLAKALALRTGLPQIVLPTTYAGSEMTPVLGETKDNRKVTQRDPKILPQTVIYDPDLTLHLPVAISVTSGMNAIAHAVEALYARDGNPVISLMAQEGISRMAQALPHITASPEAPTARKDALYGAFLCGAVLGVTSMALHHKLAHVLGGLFNLPHAQTHTALLPHSIAYNAPAAPAAMQAIAQALGAKHAASGVYDLASSLGASMALRDLGMQHAGIEAALAQTLADPYWNPRPLEEEGLRALLTRAFQGLPPQEDH